MVKKGYFECNKCNRVFKGKKSFTHHKCDTEVNQKCYICNYIYPTNKMSRHLESCQYRQYLKIYWTSFWFFFKLIMIYNDNLKVYNYIGTKNSKRDFIKKCLMTQNKVDNSDHGIDLRKYKSTFDNEVKIREQKEKDFIKQQSVELNNTNEYNEQVIIEATNEFSPSISGRQIIFDFLKNKNIHNKKLYNKLNIRLEQYDYPTNEELSENKYLFNQIKKLRKESSKYNDYYFKFSKLLEDIINNNEKYQCVYCKKLIIHKIKHYKICDLCEKSFNNNKNTFIYNFLKINYDPIKFKEKEQDDIVFYFENKSFDQFINNISSYIRNKILTREKIENKQNENLNNNNKFDVKQFMKDFIEEYDRNKDKESNDNNDNIDDLNLDIDDENDNDNDNKENNDNDNNEDNDNDNKNDNNMNNNELDENRTLVYKTDNEDNDNDEEDKEIPTKKEENQIQRTTDMVFKSIINNPMRLKVNNVQFINNIDRYIHTVKNDENENENNNNNNNE